MIDVYNEECRVTYSDVDFNLKLNALSAVRINQNMVSSYFFHNQIDGNSLKKSYNGIMIITKNRIEFKKTARWNDLIKGTIYMCHKIKYRLSVEAEFKNEDNEILFVSKSEACIIDYDTREVLTNSMIKQEPIKSIYNFKKNNLNKPLNEYKMIYNLKVLPTDIDFSNHVNNVVYVRYALNSLDFDFLSSINIKSLEIHYIKEALINDNLTIYNKIEDDSISFLISRDKEELVRIMIEYNKTTILK